MQTDEVARNNGAQAIRVEVPTELNGKKLEPGHYIVHYRWKGYADCVDVNVHPSTRQNIDGRDDDSYASFFYIPL